MLAPMAGAAKLEGLGDVPGADDGDASCASVCPQQALYAGTLQGAKLPAPSDASGGGEDGSFAPPPACHGAEPAALLREREEIVAEPLRWHAEWSPDGLRLWLGLDLGRAGSLSAMIEPLLIEARRRAEARGTRLLSFVCNGRSVYEARQSSTLTRSTPEET